MIDLLLTETPCTIEAAMRLSYQITVAINCWHRIDTAWKVLTGTEVDGNYMYNVCLDLCT